MIKRQKVEDEIFQKEYKWEDADIPFGDLPKDLLDTDKIQYESDPGYYSDNNSWDPFTKITVLRERDQTDEEYQKTITWWENRKAESKKARYEQYLKLKKEFESDEKRSD